MHILSAKDVTKQTLEGLIDLAAQLEGALSEKKQVKFLKDKIVATLFFEPSTRTRFSFESAVMRLGGEVLSLENGVTSSIEKGESYQDMGRVVSGYADAIVMRHPHSSALQNLASFCSVPIVNAGDGANEHPTQALLDMFTIYKEKGRLDRLKVGLIGDLKYGRTVHSLVNFLKYYKNSIYLISPNSLKMPTAIRDELIASGCQVVESASLEDEISNFDIVYSTRVQEERINEVHGLYDRKPFVIDSKTLEKIKSDSIILHPLPRVDELSREVDADPRACYFKQAQNGLYMRMALLCHLLCGGYDVAMNDIKL